jgi:hypothetical protein
MKNQFSKVSYIGFEGSNQLRDFIYNLEFNPRQNAEAIVIANPSPNDLISVISIYLNALIDNFKHHEDSFRDFSTDILLSCFEEFKAEIYEENTGNEYISDPNDDYDDYFNAVEYSMVISFYKNSKNPNLTDDKRKEFAYGIVRSFINSDPVEFSRPNDLIADFDKYMIDSLTVVAEKLKDTSYN